MLNRRNFLLNAAAATSGLTLAPWLQEALGAPATGRAPMRFIFMHKGNGLFPHVMVPPSLGRAEMEKERRKEAFSVNLARHDLPDWMRPVVRHKSHMTILQGLSGKMCTTGHHTWQSSLGVYKANEALTSIKWATVDFELAKRFPSPLDHIELACFPHEGGNARGNVNGIETGFSARGPQQPNLAYGSPKVALRELFRVVSNERREQVQYELERMVLGFTVDNHTSLARNLQGIERTKIANYAESIDAVRTRNGRLEAMAEVIRRHLPRLDDKYLADDINTIDRQWGHVEILLATLISGMTNVVTFTVDELGTIYTGLKGLERDPINLHDVGHGKGVGTFSAEAIRTAVRTQHMSLIDTIITRLKAVPEADGNMFDNTTLFYFPDNGETHHSTGVEWPFLVFSGRNARLNISGRYIRLPAHGQEGHKTLGNWYTTILNAYGNPIAHYGDLDLALERMKMNQRGPIREFLA
jgi:hypothetical protein